MIPATVYTDAELPYDRPAMVFAIDLARALGELTAPEPAVLDLSHPVEREVLEEISPDGLGDVQVASTPRPSSWAEEMLVFTHLKPRLVVMHTTQVARLPERGPAVMLCEFPVEEDHGVREDLRLARFDRFFAVSRFSALWISARWDETAEVLYPPIHPVEPAEKERIILCRAPFVSGRRGQGQTDMLDTFERLRKRGAADDWHLHLAGDVEDGELYNELRRRALGHPVHLHPDPDLPVVRQLVSRASIMWNAAGADADPEEEPELLKPFGVEIAEAMTAGVVPVVVGRGGLIEMVGSDEHGGILWDNWGECLNETERLCRDPELLERLSKGARERARRFSPEAFRRRVGELFGPLVEP
jgi:glycosyltransferase involved in cell wall biosynthesis